MEDKPPPFSKMNAAMAASDLRTKMVREQIEKERAATDAKTAKLKALRLAKESAEQAAGISPSKPKGKRGR
jgi:hypothetical protein